MKKPIRFRLTHRNIRARYEAAKTFDPSFSHRVMSIMFGVHRQEAYKWCRVITDENGVELQNDKRAILPSGERKKKVLAWINDGVLAQQFKGKEIAPIKSNLAIKKE